MTAYLKGIIKGLSGKLRNTSKNEGENIRIQALQRI